MTIVYCGNSNSVARPSKFWLSHNCHMSVWLPVPQGNHEMTQPNKMTLLSLKIDCCDEAYADQFLMTVFLAQGYHPCSVFFFFPVDWRLKF